MICRAICLKYGAVDVDAVVVQIAKHQVDSWQLDLKSSTQVLLKPVSIDAPNPDVVWELDGRVFADDAETVVDKATSLHLVCDLRDAQRRLQFVVRRQIKHVVLCETWNVQRLILVGVQCHSIQTYLRLTHTATVKITTRCYAQKYVFMIKFLLHEFVTLYAMYIIEFSTQCWLIHFYVYHC